MVEKENFKNICEITARSLGFTTDDLALKSRKQPLQIARSVAGYIGITEKIHPKTIAKAFKRNRTLIYHYGKCHKDKYANCEYYRKAFNKVYKAFKSIDGDMEIFLDGDFMKTYLLKNGVKESKDDKNSEVILEVKSDKVKCKIRTSYFDFSNQMEIIKFVLKNYHYEIKII
tara:strand:+ start:2727 stop:3242 length:516 start_codon:yes stop_codon:yes gene_type:complete